jgi:hypothetical protein
MYFDTKSYLKSNRNHTAKHTLCIRVWICLSQLEDLVYECDI